MNHDGHKEHDGSFAYSANNGLLQLWSVVFFVPVVVLTAIRKI